VSEALLELAVDILGPLTDELVFVGGATVHLWITEPAAPAVRATDDVDVICDVTGYREYNALAERLRERSLQEAMNENVICRWRHSESGLVIDVMPTDEAVLGFSNRWYELAIETATEYALPSERTIRAVKPPVLLATKLAAWRGRGHDDVLKSLDVHDIVVLINGRPELIDELSQHDADLRDYVAEELATLTADLYFDYVIQDMVNGYGEAATARAQLVRDRIAAILEQVSTN
jgi:predicted nucleotidyltransferase